MKSKLIIALSFIVSMLAFSGCDNELKDGDWPPIQIIINGEICKAKEYAIPAEGGTFRIFSKNYGSLWLNAVSENDNHVWPEGYDWSDYLNIHLTKTWYELRYDGGGQIVVDIQPIEPNSRQRTLLLELECGDAFGSIKLVQQ